MNHPFAYAAGGHPMRNSVLLSLLSLLSISVYGITAVIFFLIAGMPDLVYLCLFVSLSCPFILQSVDADGRPPLVWICWRSLPVKREFFLSTDACCAVHTEDGGLKQTEDLMQSAGFLCKGT